MSGETPLVKSAHNSYAIKEALKKYLEAPQKHNAGPTLTQRTVSPPTSSFPANDYDGLYNCSWFRKMTLLIYLIFLNIAADALYDFPYSQNEFPYSQDTNSLAQSASVIAIPYIQWLALDIAIVWVFVMVALHWPIWGYYRSSSNGHRPDQKSLIELMLPHQDIACFATSNKTKGSGKWYILVFLGLSTSVIFDVHTYHIFF